MLWDDLAQERTHDPHPLKQERIVAVNPPDHQGFSWIGPQEVDRDGIGFEVVREEARLVKFLLPLRKIMRRSVSRLLSVKERRAMVCVSRASGNDVYQGQCGSCTLHHCQQ